MITTHHARFFLKRISESKFGHNKYHPDFGFKKPLITSHKVKFKVKGLKTFNFTNW
jgi:hypothetical protein